jgi:colanic acid/amylovoran biosynthesis glycosyltransferase
MRVAHLIETFSLLSETFLYEQVRELERRNGGSRVFTFARENALSRPFERVELLRRPRFVRARRALDRVFAGRLGSAGEWYTTRRALARGLARDPADLLHAHFGPMGVLAAPVAEALGIPLVVSFYGYDLSRLLSQPHWVRRYRSLWESATRVVVLSAHMARRAEEHGCPPEKIAIVHLARRLSDFPFRAPTGRVRRLLSVGRLVEKKGHLDAVRALALAVDQGVDVSLTIIGEGPQRSALERCVRDNGLAERVVLLGPKPSAEIRAHMAEADAFFLASRRALDGDEEGTPTVLIEAQATGLPCISTLHAGIPEMIPSENAWLLAPEGDVQALADRIGRISGCDSDELSRIATRGRRFVELHFDVADAMQPLLELYGAGAPR